MKTDHVPGSTKGEGGYNAPGSSRYLPPHERLQVAVPFRVSDLGMDLFQNLQREFQDDFGIKLSFRPRHTHCQLNILGYPGVRREAML